MPESLQMIVFQPCSWGRGGTLFIEGGGGHFFILGGGDTVHYDMISGVICDFRCDLICSFQFDFSLWISVFISGYTDFWISNAHQNESTTTKFTTNITLQNHVVGIDAFS